MACWYGCHGQRITWWSRQQSDVWPEAEIVLRFLDGWKQMLKALKATGWVKWMVWGCFCLRNVSEEHKKLSLEEETMWLRIRTLTLRLISGLPNLTHPVEPKNSEKTSENGVSSRIDILRLLLQQLEVAVETGKRFIEKEIQVSTSICYQRLNNYFSNCLLMHNEEHILFKLWHCEKEGFNGLEPFQGFALSRLISQEKQNNILRFFFFFSFFEMGFWCIVLGGL